MPDHDYAQRALLGLLLEEHPRMLDIAEVRQRLSDVDRVDDAAKILAADGLARQMGDLIGATRAAVRADQLSI